MYDCDIPMQPRPWAETLSLPIVRWGYSGIFTDTSLLLWFLGIEIFSGINRGVEFGVRLICFAVVIITVMKPVSGMSLSPQAYVIGYK
jgi:hypothetical protein